MGDQLSPEAGALKLHSGCRNGYKEGENFLIRGLKRLYRPVLTRPLRSPAVVIIGAVVLFFAALLLFTRLGQEFIPTLDEKNIAMHA